MNRRTGMWMSVATVVVMAALARNVSGQEFIVKDGQPRAEIVTGENPCSSVKLAATELQEYIRKMSGTTLPIQSGRSAAELPVKIYVGRSRHTDRLGVTGTELQWGAYRIQSGEGWLALIGNDTVFTPQGVYAETRGKWMSEGVEEWKKAAGTDWGNPIGPSMYRKYSKQLDLWRYDEKGTLNAVYGFLRSLGVRWYMAGELGEIVPELKSIPLPDIAQTVKPDYPIRMVAYARYGGNDVDEVMWSLRLGVNDPYGYHQHHGLANVTRSTEVREKHPDYLALYNGERQVRERTANPCLSSEGLFKETLRYVRFMFDMYDVPIMSVWPDDGFSSMCQCEKCKGKDTPERGREGVMSDYVWDFINRVAIEIEKTHPGKLISGGAYSTYRLPPEKIDKLNSNVVVYIVNARRRFPQEDLRLDDLKEWGRKTDGKVISFMNVGGGANTPHLFADDIRRLESISIGEDMWPPFYKGGLADPGFNHLNYYISARYEWDADLDIDQVLDEYYRLYYGPVAKEMAAFVDYYEAHQREMGAIDSAPMIKEALDLFEAVKSKVDPKSIYGQRVALFDKGLAGRRKRYALVKAGRVDVPEYHLSGDAAEMQSLTIDGKLNEAFWQTLPGQLKPLQEEQGLVHATSFRVGVSGNSLYVGILCRDEPGQPLNAVELEKDDAAIWVGDMVEIILETPEHSYYQIDINPLGAVADLDRGAESKTAWFTWDAQADIATSVDQDAGTWSVEARIPFTPSAQDPLHEVIGPAPSASQPWYFNICRQRSRNQREDLEMSAFSPTGEKGFHNLLKFAKLK